MQLPTPIADINLHEIAALEAEIRSKLGPPGVSAQRLPASLEARRAALLANHLGYAPIPPISVIHVIGDSHAVFFAGAESMVFTKGRRVWTGFLRARYVSAFTELLPVFRVFHVGPATAWQAHESGSSTCAREKINKLLRSGDIPSAARVLLVFGEIDCRCHIPKAVLAGSSIEKAVAATVGRFMRLPVHLKTLGRTPSVWLPSLQPHFGDAIQSGENEPLPVIGLQALRDEITLAYCEQLQAACMTEGILTAGLCPPPVAQRDSCFIDGHHLSQSMMPDALAALVQAGILPLATGPTLPPK